MTPEEAFILSRIDGTLTPTDIFKLSHLSEEDTARTLLGLLRSGIVELESAETDRKSAKPERDEPSEEKERQDIERVFVELQKQNDLKPSASLPERTRKQ